MWINGSPAPLSQERSKISNQPIGLTGQPARPERLMGTELKGVFAEIDTTQSLEAMETLRSGSEEDRVRIAEQIAANSADYCPAVFFALAAYHHQANRTPIGLFWLFAGRIRTWFDIQRSTDRSVEAAADALGNSVPELLR